MISRRLRESLDSSICIRDIFEEGKKLAAIYGAENIFNFTIGNPSVEPPAAVNEALKEIIDTENRWHCMAILQTWDIRKSAVILQII